MGEQIIQQHGNFSFFKNHFFSYQISRAINDCHKIEKYLLSKDYLSKSDSKLNLLISNGINNEVENCYFLYKSYNKDGSINPICKYNIINGEIVKDINLINKDVTVIDLYEESIYLHSCLTDTHYITGYLIKEKIKSKVSKTLIFTNVKVKIYIKNINKFHTINIVDNFISDFIL